MSFGSSSKKLAQMQAAAPAAKATAAPKGAMGGASMWSRVYAATAPTPKRSRTGRAGLSFGTIANMEGMI